MAGTPHRHSEYVAGCFRCDLAQDEVVTILHRETRILDYPPIQVNPGVFVSQPGRRHQERYVTEWVDIDTDVPSANVEVK